MVCPNCGRPVGAGEKFCGSCGYPVSQGNLAGDGAAAERAKRKKEKRIVLIVLVVLLALAVLIAVGVWLTRRSGTEEPSVSATASAVETTAAAQTTLPSQNTDPAGTATQYAPMEKQPVFDVFSFYDVDTGTGHSPAQIIAVYGEPEEILNDPEGYTGAVEYRYDNMSFRFWEEQVYYFQIRNANWQCWDPYEHEEMFGLEDVCYKTSITSEEQEFFYCYWTPQLDSVCIGLDPRNAVVCFLSVTYRIPDPWRAEGPAGKAAVLNPPVSLYMPDYVDMDTDRTVSEEDIIDRFGQPIVRATARFGYATALCYEHIAFAFVQDTLVLVEPFDYAWQVDSKNITGEILTKFGLRNSPDLYVDLDEDGGSLRNCGIYQVLVDAAAKDENTILHNVYFCFVSGYRSVYEVLRYATIS